MIGRQKGNFDVLRHFVHLNETTLNRVKSLGMTEKGKKSEFLIVVGENAETTHSLYIVPTPLEYWLLTTYPRERWYLSARNPIITGNTAPPTIAWTSKPDPRPVSGAASPR